MRLRSIIAALVVVLIVAAGLFYFYGFRNRTISADINSIKEGTSEAATTMAVRTALSLNKQVSSYEIHVETNNGVATLTGQVPTENDKRTVEDITRSTKGVENVVNNLSVDPKAQAAVSDKQRATDLEIKVALLEGVLNNPQLKTQNIKVDVFNNDVRLTGNVQSSDQKATAESIARAIPNVHTVDSYGLAVTNTPSTPSAAQTQNSKQAEDEKLSAMVESALSRESALTFPQKIKVQSTNGVVYLTGTAASKAEKALAGQLAHNTAGAKDVVNNIDVTTKR
jgi:hyperosmotically inducible periplasmic protein